MRQSLRLEMTPGSRAIILDAIAAGRVAHEDPWLFREIDSSVEVLMCGKPVFLNRTGIVPAIQNPRGLGIMEDFKYMATMGILGEGQMEWESVASAMTAELATVPSIRGGGKPARARRLCREIPHAQRFGVNRHEPAALGRGA